MLYNSWIPCSLHIGLTVLKMLSTCVCNMSCITSTTLGLASGSCLWTVCRRLTPLSRNSHHQTHLMGPPAMCQWITASEPRRSNFSHSDSQNWYSVKEVLSLPCCVICTLLTVSPVTHQLNSHSTQIPQSLV